MIGFPASIWRQLGLLFWNRIKDICKVLKCAIKTASLPPAIPIIFFSDFPLLTDQSIKYACSYRTVFSVDIEWWFFVTNLSTVDSELYKKSCWYSQVTAALILGEIMSNEENTWGYTRNKTSIFCVIIRRSVIFDEGTSAICGWICFNITK